MRANKALKEEKRLPINHKYRNFPMVPKVVYGKGCFDQLGGILGPQRRDKAPFIYLVDDVFKNDEQLIQRIPLRFNDKLLFISSFEEPKQNRSMS